MRKCHLSMGNYPKDCIEANCMAWIPAKLKIGNIWKDDERGILTLTKGEEYQPGYCKLIGEIQ